MDAALGRKLMELVTSASGQLQPSKFENLIKNSMRVRRLILFGLTNSMLFCPGLHDDFVFGATCQDATYLARTNDIIIVESVYRTLFRTANIIRLINIVGIYATPIWDGNQH
jgi:hypothetical protein